MSESRERSIPEHRQTGGVSTCSYIEGPHGPHKYEHYSTSHSYTFICTGRVFAKGVEPDLLTAAEKRAIELSGELATLVFREVIGAGMADNNDAHEFGAMIHGIQGWLMSQAAARAYPDLFRLKGVPKP